ncbi:MAG: hypothetical protein WD205_04750, partial [Rhodothermales bacterium]
AFSPQFDDVAAAIWWAFLRLSDPGYLGDDEGVLLRTVSTVITVLGYVVFLGSLVAIMTQWLNETMRTLQSGLTPIAVRNHILILGWTNRTPTIVQELMLSEGRVARFLSRRGVRRLRIVILTDEVSRERMAELHETVGSRWREHRIILRSGTSLRMDHLRRVAYRNASVVIIPGADFLLGGAAVTDARVVKTIIALAPGDSGHSSRCPTVVAEVFDPHKRAIAENAYRGGEINVLSSDTFVSRLIAQNVRHRGLSYIYAELLSHGVGNEIYVRRLPEFDGRPFGECVSHVPHAIALGVVRPEGTRFVPYLNPGADFTIEKEDRLIFIAQSYDQCGPEDDERIEETETIAWKEGGGTVSNRRILVLGWSHKLMALLDEFGGYENERFQIDVLSRIPVDERTAALSDAATSDRVSVRHILGDYTVWDKLSSAQPSTYENVVFLASDWLDSEEESDARTVLGYVLLRSILEEADHRPELLIELMDPENARLFKRRLGEVIISPMILSHLLAHVALRGELNVVFSRLFGAGGAEFTFYRAGDVGLDGHPVGIRALRRAAAAKQQIVLGVRIRSEFNRTGGGVYLNPPPERRWILQPDDEIILLAEE